MCSCRFARIAILHVLSKSILALNLTGIEADPFWEMESPGSNVRDHVWPSAGQTFSEFESTYDAFAIE
jgi:hypothetical protein